MRKTRFLRRLLHETFAEWRRDNVYDSAAALSFYGIFSLSPLLLVLIVLGSVYLDPRTAQEEILRQFGRLAGPEETRILRALFRQAHQQASAATFFTTAMLLIGAATVFAELQGTLNRMWRIRPRRRVGAFLKRRLLAFGMVLAAGVLVMASVIASAVISYLARNWEGTGLALGLVLRIAAFLASFFILMAVFAMIYRLLPETTVGWEEVWAGAATASLLFSVGKTLLGLYLSSGILRSTYGAASSLVVFLIWVYYSSHACLFGAEVTKVWGRMRGIPRV